MANEEEKVPGVLAVGRDKDPGGRSPEDENQIPWDSVEEVDVEVGESPGFVFPS